MALSMAKPFESHQRQHNVFLSLPNEVFRTNIIRRMPYQANTVNGWWLQYDVWSNNPHYHTTLANCLLHDILANSLNARYQTLQNSNIKHRVNCFASGNPWNRKNKSTLTWFLTSFGEIFWLRLLSRLPFRTLKLGFGFVLKAPRFVTSYNGVQKVSILFCLFNDGSWMLNSEFFFVWF